MNEVIDDNKLGLVLKELVETVRQARHQLEVYLDDSNDAGSLESFMLTMRQVHGTARMVEIAGAELLAGELIRAAEILQEGNADNNDEILDGIMRATLQYPDYLEYLGARHRDYPGALLPVVNELRKARGKVALTEGDLYFPCIDVPVPDNVWNPAEQNSKSMQDEARESRHLFQASLLAWYKGKDIADAIAGMAEVSGRLLASSTDETTARFWWVASCAIEILSGENKPGKPVDISLKFLLGKLDREIKRIIDAGDAEFTGAAQQDLLRNLLVCIGRSLEDSPRLSGIRQAFGISHTLPDQSEVSNAMESITGCNQELMTAVSAEIRDELENVKDSLDIFIRSKSGNINELSPLIDNLHNLANTLGVLGLDSANEKILENKLRVEQMLAGERELCDDELMDIASTLLYVESSLSGMPCSSSSEQAELFDVALVADDIDPAYRQVMNVVIDEVVSDIAAAKEQINTFILSEPADIGQLENVPGYFNQIKGGLQLAGEDYASSLVGALNEYISSNLLENQNIPETAHLDLLADSICSIEYYLESIKDQRRPDAQILSVAERSLKLLGCDVLQLNVESGDAGQEIEDESGSHASTDVVADPDYEVVFNSDEGSDSDLADQGNDSHEEEITATDAEGYPVQPESDHLMEAGPAVSTEGSSESGKGDSADELAVIGSEVDQEILEIFIEEAEEVIEVIQNLLPSWLENDGDSEALQTIRRSFHTIKGSGRMVGATYIGEFAWEFENLLNRVIDNTIEAGEGLKNLLRDIDQPLLELLAQIKQGITPTRDITGLMNAARQLSAGECPDSETGDVEVEEVSNRDAASVDPEIGISGNDPSFEAEIPDNEETVPAGMDHTLYEIFNKETRGYLAALREYTETCHASQEGCTVSDDLMRVLHTLNGSARMAEVDSFAALAGEIHRYFGLLQDASQQVPAEGIEVLNESVALMGNILDQLPSHEPALEECQSLIDRIQALPVGEVDVPGSVSVSQHPDREAAEPEIDTAESRDDAELVDQSVCIDDIQEPALDDAGNTKQLQEQEEVPDMYAGLDQDLLEIFMEEGKEILDQSEEILQQWKSSPDNMELMTEYQRQLHTLKGGARMVGIEVIGNLSHSLETLVTNLVNDQVVPGKQEFDVLIDAQDRLTRMLERVYAREPISSADDLVGSLESINHPAMDDQSADHANGDEHKAESVEEVETVPAADLPAENAEILTPEAGFGTASDTENRDTDKIAVFDGPREKMPDLVPPQEERDQGEQKKQEQVRVRSGLLDDLVNYSGEINIYRSRMEQQVGAFRFNLVELENTVNRLRDQLRKLQIETDTQILFRYDQDEDRNEENFDPLEMDRYSNMQQLSRSLIESVSDLASIHGLLGNITRESETLLLQQSRVNTELHEGLMHTRMLPFGGLAPRLRRVVRQTCNDLGKKAELLIEGADAEIDRTVIDRIIAPLEHMLRNALSHGIETPEDRLAAGKPDEGIIKIELYREGPEVVIRLSDDGAGIDHESVRKKAIERGLMFEDASLSDNDILQFILETGFSTAKEVTQVSGRGVGMDVVNSEVKQLGGSLHIDSRATQGSVFTIRLPFTLSITQALLVKSGEETYCIPLTSIEGVVRVSASDLAAYYADSNLMYEYAGNEYKLMNLGVLLGHGMQMDADRGSRTPVLLYRSGEKRIALHVDELIGNREIVVKAVGKQLSTVQCVSGATVLGDGRVSMILDISALARTALQNEPVNAVDSADDSSRKLSIMVVDDSITVRRVTTRLLERNGINVITAKDGVEALAQLQESIPDIMLLDIEMPRMDGFELATHMRNDRRLMHIPIIMITSRMGYKHKQRAMEIGVDRYLGKPYQEHDLLDNIYRLLEEEQV